MKLLKAGRQAKEHGAARAWLRLMWDCCQVQLDFTGQLCFLVF